MPADAAVEAEFLYLIAKQGDLLRMDLCILAHCSSIPPWGRWIRVHEQEVSAHSITYRWRAAASRCDAKSFVKLNTTIAEFKPAITYFVGILVGHEKQEC